ncbi:hypothetical protein PMAG_a3501 [Pseudoalteromonas mariniglutinosa NCIMB 1770]|nr:hypothetical protein [Pseudoalteromonas mariniglutinosa NCIMB 1770]
MKQLNHLFLSNFIKKHKKLLQKRHSIESLFHTELHQKTINY